jgi:glyoxylase-like metal-dependent hydrolase (beta-lactamase superfamily II)
MSLLRAVALFFSLSASAAQAAPFETVQVTPRVYALVGDLGQRSPTNLGHNMTSGFIVGDDAVVVVDSGASKAGAEAIQAAVRAVTPKPIRWVINTGGQDHRWLGNAWFKSQGATIIAAVTGAQDMRTRSGEHMAQAAQLIGERFAGTEPRYPDITFEGRYTVPLKGVAVELIHTGGAHTPGDLFVWLPRERIAFTGDAVYVQRLLGIRDQRFATWIASLEYLRDTLKPAVVIPGHGHVTNLSEAMRDSLGYLVMLRERVRERIAAGAFDAVEAAEGLDQSAFAYLQNYDDLPFRAANARRVAEALFAAE